MKYFLLFLTIISGVFAYDYHGCTLATDNLHGWVVCLDTVLILHTTDGGSTWQPQNPPAGSRRFFDITCFDEFCAWTCGILGEILHTENGGLDWIMQVYGLSFYATRIEFLDENYGWTICCDGVIGRTTNGGNFWEAVFTPYYEAIFYGVSFVNQWDGWIVAGYPDSLATGQGCILRSTDGGVNWDSLYHFSAYEDFFDVYFFNTLNGIVVGGDESDYSPIILKTTDGGITWNSISAPVSSYYLRAVDFVDDEGWAVGKYGTIIHTTDYGNTWTFQTNPAESTLFDVDFSDNLHGIACGHNIILYTTDGGQNWLPTGIEEDTRSPKSETRLIVYPNPAKGNLRIRFNLPDERKVTVKLYDVSGRLVNEVFTGKVKIGMNEMSIITANYAAGIYFVSIETDKEIITEKFIMLK
jgi:photosystem II stability/assembly factor-like uncharacterized protein